MVDNFAIGVVAHIKRQDFIEELSNKIKPDMIAVDDGSLGVAMNHYATMNQLRAKFADRWLVVLEDDCLPVEGFRDQITESLAVAPSKLVSLYMGTGYPAQYQKLFTDTLAANPDACWLIHPQLRHGVGYAVHPEVSRALLIRMEDLVLRRFSPEDAITRWALQNRTPVAYTNPSLVDHRDTGTVIDYRMHMGHVGPAGRNRPRHAYKAGTRGTWTDSCATVRPL